MAMHPSRLQPWLSGQPKAVRWGLPLFLGVVMALGHEPWTAGMWPVLLALTIALLALPVRWLRAAGFGWLLGVGYFAVTLRWIVEPFMVDPLRHGWMAPFAMVLMAGGLALFWALAFGAARWLAGSGKRAVLLAPITLVAVELLRGHLLSGFPWGLLSYTMVGGFADIWLAWVGPYGASLVLAGVVGVTAYGLHRSWAWVWPGIVGALVATLGLQAISATTMPVSEQTVRVIQPNAPQHQKWDPEWMPVFFDRAIEQTLAGDPVDVVIWPETSVPARLNFAGPWLEQMVLSARGAPVVAGIQRQEAGAYYNSLVVADGPGDIAGLYDKSHLVPFGEYIPLAWLLEPIGLGVLVDQVAGFSPGSGDELLPIGGLGVARVLICYEGIFPEEIQRGEVRPDILVIITNDAWFGTGAGPRQHLVQAQARAIEQGLPVIRSANTGISAVIDARGRIMAQLPLNEAGYLDSLVPAALSPTLYARMGDWPLLVLLISICGVAVLTRNRFGVDAAGAGV